MAMEQTSLQMVTCTSANTRTANLQDSASTSGPMAIHTQENSRLAKSMVRANGERSQRTNSKRTDSISMMDIMKWIKSMVMVNSSGNQETNTRVITTRMRDKAMVPWSGPTAVSIGGTGSEVFSMALVS